jgi:hypothetical protein
MLSFTEVRKYAAAHRSQDLLADGTFFRFLIDRALGAGPTDAPRRDLRALFARVADELRAAGSESVSGPGSCLARTHALRRDLPALLRELDIQSLLDAPCGDFVWMQHVVDAVRDYTGVDIVPELVAQNRERHGSARRRFACADLTRDPLPRADLILCRDLLVHLTFAEARRVLDNFRRSGARYLLATTFPAHPDNRELDDTWRTLDLTRPPFSFPTPLRLLDEQCSEAGGRYADKSLGLWRLGDLCR